MKMTRLLCGILVSTIVAGAGADPILGPDKAVQADIDAWPAFNWASFDQEKVVSHGGFQYSVFWDAQRRLTVARRNLATDEVQTLSFPDHLLADGFPEAQTRNGHRNTVIGISPGDGRLHLSWDHHNNDLNYTRSRAGFINDPPARMSLEDFEAKQSLADGAPQGVTYPQFFNNHREKLFLLYRSGGSGAGDMALFEYDHSNGNWNMISDRLLGREGVYEPWNNSETRNPYMHDILFDNTGRLHITWVYREISRSWASNHDLHYAYSDDEGRTWKNNAGEVIADVTRSQRITLDSPGIRVWEIPVYSWLMNQCGMTLDSKNQPHVVTYHMAEPYRPDKLEHNPPADVHHRLNYYHYWRDTDGTWHRSDPLPMPLPRRRPMIVAAPDDTIVIYFTTSDGFVCHVARAQTRWSEWKTLRLTGPEYRVNDVTKPDRRRLREASILSFTADPKGQREESGYAFLDFDLARLLLDVNPR